MTVGHTVIGNDPFTVEYVSKDGRKKQVVYDIYLLPKEIISNYPYIIYEDEPAFSTMRVRVYRNCVLFMNGHIVIFQTARTHIE